MAVWTEAQQKVIDTRNKNMLVSAAAGSGKTAVLVERIITMISEGEQPIDIDHLLVVTFTNAAAAQMRERIGKAIDKKLLTQPDNLHLQKQISLLQSAQITTIHSFCLNVIRNYFHHIDLDPSFKLAEESEITLMQSDVMSEVLERWYEEGREEFHEFIESYSYSKSDLPIEELVLQLYRFAMSNPWPKAWLEELEKSFEISSLADLEAADWMQELLRYLKAVLSDLVHKNEEAAAVCEEADGPAAYLAALMSDRELLDRLITAGTFSEYAEYFAGISYARLSSKKEEGVSQDKKDLVKLLREEMKKGIKDLGGQFFFQTPEEMLKDLQAVKNVMKVLFELTIDFLEEFAVKKEEKNLIDFNDLEHFALNILVEDKEGEKVPTRAALELSELFEEILIDEYQDSNLVQETILKSISREHIGKSNRFMVGDVKQSIYKFRLAMPELFMEKYRTYSTKELLDNGEVNTDLRIDLDKNFRSRKVVLDCVNKVFEQIMTEAVGGIVYDEAAALKYGELFEELLEGKSDQKEKAVPRINDKIDQSIYVQSADDKLYEKNYEEPDGMTEETITLKPDNSVGRLEMNSRIATEVELMLITDEERKSASEANGPEAERKDSRDISAGGEEVSEETEDSEEAVYTKKELEARTVASRIKELVNSERGMMLFDRDTLTYRPAAYRDIVILLRSMSGWSELFVNTLMQEGIPAYADTGAGYFSTVEIMTVLNMLRIIDNPRQDIPFVGVLYSPIVGLTTTELAQIRVQTRNKDMYQAVCGYAREGSGELKVKLSEFLTLLNNLRSKVKYTPIHEVIQEVLDQTGYYYYVLAMPGGDRRKANLDMLVNQAVRFEKGSYSGLFHFNRYIEKLHKYEVDFGEAATLGEQDNTVRIMSIHKSKGLEFPIVFVAGLSKQFNNQDIRNSIVIHSEYGVGPDYIDSKLRTKVPTLLKKVIQKKIQLENLGEELRVLYVAMTRAKEKLIMSGYIKSRDEIKRKNFTFFELMSSKSYLELVLPSMLNCMNGVNLPDKYPGSIHKDGLRITLQHKDNLLSEELAKQVLLRMEEEELRVLQSDRIFDQAIRDEIKSRFNHKYPYQKVAGLKVKMTVSELKKLGQFIDEEQSEHLFPEALSHLEETEQEQHPSETAEYSLPETEDNLLQEQELTIPEFIRGTGKATSGTDRGTLYHKVLELLDLSAVGTKEELLAELGRMVKENKLKSEEIKKLKQDYIFGFTQSKVAARMRKAQEHGKLYKEQQFVMGVKAEEVIESQAGDELILIQGIIDVFFEEDGELVLLDYKSDIVESEEQLVRRYRVQLDYYKKALEQILKKRVKEMVIYSLYLGKEITV